MLHKPLLLVGILLVSGAVVGQGTVTPPSVVGLAANVQGLVTVSDGKSIASVIDGSQLVDGSRIVTSSSGSITLKTNSGCDIRLGPNESITLLGQRSCEALIASIQALPGEFMIASGTTKTLVAAGTSLLTSAVLLRSSMNTSSAAPEAPGSGGSIPNIPISDQ